jgi:WD40 repeat protein
MLTQHQIQSPVDINPLLNTATDCLRFVTEFSEVISQSRSHIYHSALLLAPQSSVVWNLYSKHICSPVSRVVSGIPASWDLCRASTGAEFGVDIAVWSSCGQFVASAAKHKHTIQIWDSNTLERVSVLSPPTKNLYSRSLSFSPNGHLLICICIYVNSYKLVVPPVFVSILMTCTQVLNICKGDCYLGYSDRCGCQQ